MKGALIASLAILLSCVSGENQRLESRKKKDAPPTLETWTKPIPKMAAARFSKAAVAADHFTCSRIGTRMLQKGGHAVDAIIAVHLCTEIMQPHSTGLGGGGFMIVHDKDKGDTAINFRETVPMGYDNSTIEKAIGDTILVPGVVAGLWAAHQKYGKLPWADLFVPAIQLCEEGFRVHSMLAMAIDKKLPDVLSHLGMKQDLAPNGPVIEVGQLKKSKKLGRTYRMLQNATADLFYKGAIGDQVVKDIREVGGSIQKSDLENFKVKETKPLEIMVAGKRLQFLPPPSGGILIAFILKILDEYDQNVEKINDLKKDPAKYYHVIIEAFKLGYGPFSFLGDDAFTPKAAKYVKYMTDPKNALDRAKKIKSQSQPLEYYKPYSEMPKKQEGTGTSHMSALGTNGDAVSLTSSINAYFGSKLRSRELGFYYNNEITDFAEFWPSVYGLNAELKFPGRAPMSRSSPMLFLDASGGIEAVWGAAGGHFIPTAMVTTIANWLFFKDDLKVAISRPRIHCQLFPPSVVMEPSFPHALVPELRDKFKHADMTNNTYDVTGAAHAILGVIQAIVKDGDKWAAESDYRKGGLADGF